MPQERVDTSKWVTNIAREPQEVQAEFDGNSGYYDADMRRRGYRAPACGAALLSRTLTAKHGRILDVGCGTGMVGQELAALGFDNVVGVDISAKSLEVARNKGVYAATRQHNILERFPLEDASFDALICIGVFSRLEPEQVAPTLGEFSRLLWSGGPCLISHREDLVQQTSFIRAAADMGRWGLELLEYTEAQAYLSDDPHYADKPVRYFLFSSTTVR